MFVLTNKQKIGGFLSAAERELAHVKSQANPNQDEIAISERQVQRLREQYALFAED